MKKMANNTIWICISFYTNHVFHIMGNVKTHLPYVKANSITKTWMGKERKKKKKKERKKQTREW